ncbi:MAG: hypothetical protein U0Z75_08710 [Deinococcaceae bacterium]
MGGLNREEVLRILNGLQGSPLEDAAKFLRMFVLDNETDDIRHEIDEAARPPALLLRRGLTAIDALLAKPPPADTLIELLEEQGGLVLQPPQAEHALHELRQLAATIREALLKYPEW